MDIDDKKQIQALYMQKMVSNLPVLRASVGITQAELATLVGMSRQTIVAIEKGKRPLTWSLYLAIVMFFSIKDESNKLLSALELFNKNIF